MVTTSDQRKLFEMNATSTARAVTLPAASSAGDGFEIVVKTDGTNGTTITPNGSDTINETTSYVLASDNDAVKLICDGADNWVCTSVFKTNTGDVV